MMLHRVLANLFSRPATRPFPRTARQPVDGYRGAVEFHQEACVYCGACALRCPANAIEVDRPSKTLKFDLFKCIQCACCAEACKRGCVQLRSIYHSPVFEKPTIEFSGAPVLSTEGDGQTKG
jgi:formate hydrogenlyase subunit 6/NADH:ubiquinone oxidoreductase subunit I